jgi:choline dehydrogenase-like flavoprotein
MTCAGFQTRFAGETVAAARCLKEDGGEVFIRARAFVAAVGGLETVRLLSADDERRGVALGDHSGMLGRTYMCHIEAGVGHLQFSPPQRPVNFTFDRTDDGVYANRRFSLSRQRQDDLGVMNAVVRLHHPSVVDPAHSSPILSAVYLAKRMLPESRRKLTVLDHANIARIAHDGAFWTQHALNIVRGAPRLAAFGGAWVVQRYLNYRRVPYVAFRSPSGGYALDYNGEQAPDPDSCVRLARERDRFGLRRLVIDWRANDLDRRTARATLTALRDSLSASGCGTLTLDEDEIDEACGPLGGHHIGAARMSTSPRFGVVDANCKVHHISNLFVAGSAVFPTSGHANPTLTIVALTCRLADHLKTLLFDLDVPAIDKPVARERVTTL